MSRWTRDLSPAKPGFTAAPVVIGASARAAVHSLARAGISACAIDLFGDRDLARVAECVVCPIADYPNALPALAARFPGCPLLYTGGLENYPHIVAELAVGRDLWGNPPDVLERVRNPYSLAARGVASPSVAPPGTPCPAEGRWLRKPLKSGGGLGIRFAQPAEAASPHHYFQQFIDGVPMSALFGGTTLLGITEQLIGEPWLHARPFAYCGNIGPIDVPTATCTRLIGFGPALVVSGLRDHYGVDFILNGDGPRPVEVNPRYTAGLEVIEHGYRSSAFRPWATLDQPRSVVGKAVYYAPRAFAFPASGPWDADFAGYFDPWRLPQFADIPHPGSAVEAGFPVLTVFAKGSSASEVRERLQSRAAELDLLFADAHP